MKPLFWVSSYDSEAFLIGDAVYKAFNLLDSLSVPSRRPDLLLILSAFQQTHAWHSVHHARTRLVRRFFSERKSNILVHHVSDMVIASHALPSLWSRCKPPCIRCMRAPGFVVAIISSIIGDVG